MVRGGSAEVAVVVEAVWCVRLSGGSAKLFYLHNISET